MTVGTFHQQILEKQYFSTIKEFSNGLGALIQMKILEEEPEEQEEDSQNEMME
jgi:hypothetical protein